MFVLALIQNASIDLLINILHLLIVFVVVDIYDCSAFDLITHMITLVHCLSKKGIYNTFCRASEENQMNIAWEKR